MTLTSASTQTILTRERRKGGERATYLVLSRSSFQILVTLGYYKSPGPCCVWNAVLNTAFLSGLRSQICHLVNQGLAKIDKLFETLP